MAELLCPARYCYLSLCPEIIKLLIYTDPAFPVFLINFPARQQKMLCLFLLIDFKIVGAIIRHIISFCGYGYVCMVPSRIAFT